MIGMENKALTGIRENETHGILITIEKGDIGFDIVVKENDGLAWVDGNRIIVNARWLTNHPPDLDEVIEEINRSIIHEIIEHYYGLGHRVATYVESIIFNS